VRALRRIVAALLLAGLVLVIFGLALRIYMGSGAEDRLAADEQTGIAELRPPLAKSGFLACPPGYCSIATGMTSPVFDLPWDRLREYWLEMLSEEGRMVRVIADPVARRFVYIQHSRVFRFPDIVTAEFVPYGPDRSSIALYSRSRYGERDFSANRKRVQRWLSVLQQVARPAAKMSGGQ
jgi:hypothetical protein